MPELPEVETIRRGLAPFVENARIEDVILRRKDLRFPFPDRMAEKLNGQTILNIGRRAKYLLFMMSKGDVLLSHLGMTGNYRFQNANMSAPTRIYPAEAQGAAFQKHDHMILKLDQKGQKHTLIYSDPRRFGFVDLSPSIEESKYLGHLGPEPLGNELTAVSLASKFVNKKSPIKTALLDQSNIAGLGNIYVSEALWRVGVRPDCQTAAFVNPDGTPTIALENLIRHIRDILNAAIEAGGSTLKDFKSADGSDGYFQHNFDVYDRAEEACRKKDCGGIIVRMVQSGRSSFYCNTCQSAPLRK